MRTARCRQENEVAIVKSLLFVTCVILAATLGNAGAFAAAQGRTSCAGMETGLSSARRQEYAGLVADAVERKVKPSEVTIHKFLSNGSWRVVYADIPIADPGYFFFQEVEGRKHFKDVWGGVAQPEDRPELTSWARKLGVPERLAACFADTAIGG